MEKLLIFLTAFSFLLKTETFEGDNLLNVCTYLIISL
jgi:hypothetical protein